MSASNVRDANLFTCDYRSCGVQTLVLGPRLPVGWIEITRLGDRITFDSPECLLGWVRSLGTERHAPGGETVLGAVGSLIVFPSRTEP